MQYQLSITDKEKSGLKTDLCQVREEWRFTSMENGEQFVMMNGDLKMLQLFVDNLVTEQMVSTINYSYILKVHII